MDEFEYKVLKSPKLLDEEKLNIIGHHGWELVSVVHTEHMVYYYLKRKIEKENQTLKYSNDEWN